MISPLLFQTITPTPLIESLPVEASTFAFRKPPSGGDHFGTISAFPLQWVFCTILASTYLRQKSTKRTKDIPTFSLFPSNTHLFLRTHKPHMGVIKRPLCSASSILKPHDTRHQSPSVPYCWCRI
uniref:Uncharacterized protein n=1 Tax=Opuntia streptacantha TaxID=393608 RepID=A0A7C9B0W6_OPUST